jgi:phage tail-like protein
MATNLKAPDLTFGKSPPAGFHFLVVFFIAGIVPNPLDIRFKKVSGLSVEVETTPLKEGGQNHFVHQLPTGIKHGNLVLERGMVIGSPLNIEFNLAMSTMTLVPGNVMVTVLNDNSAPVAGWLLLKSYPVKWSVSDLDADQNGIVVDTMELAYSRFQILRI